MTNSVNLDGFRHLTDLFRDKAQEHAIKDYHYSMCIEGERSIGRMPTTNARGPDDPGKPSNKKKAEHRLALLVEQGRIALLQQLEQLQLDLDKLIIERDNVVEQVTALEACLEDYKRTGAFDLAPDGYPVNEDARKAIMEWEQRTGRKFEPYAEDATDIVQLVIADLKRHEEDLNSQIQVKAQQIEEHTQRIEDLDELKLKVRSGMLTEGQIDHELSLLEEIDNEQEYQLPLGRSKPFTFIPSL